MHDKALGIFKITSFVSISFRYEYCSDSTQIDSTMKDLSSCLSFSIISRYKHISDQYAVSVLSLNVFCRKHMNSVPGLSTDPPRHREYQGRWRRQEKYVSSKLQQTVSFIEVEPLNVYQSTRSYGLLAVWIFPK
jgi:hypothetical protein